MGTLSDDNTCMEGLAKGLPDIAMSAISCSVSLSVFWLQTQSYKAIKITKQSKPPVLRVDHSSPSSALHPRHSLCGLICHVGSSSDAGKPKLLLTKILKNHLVAHLRSFFPPLAFLCLWRKRTSIALERIAKRQRTATPVNIQCHRVIRTVKWWPKKYDYQHQHCDRERQSTATPVTLVILTCNYKPTDTNTKANTKTDTNTSTRLQKQTHTCRKSMRVARLLLPPSTTAQVEVPLVWVELWSCGARS